MSKIAQIIVLALVLSLGACQSFYPQAPALAAPHWPAQQYQRQDQVEVKWKQQSFSFLLYQQQQGQQLSMLGLSLTGQILFKLNFDGKTVKVEQRMPQMRLLPFDFLVRDILFATYPKFAQAGQANITIQQIDNQQQIYIAQQHVLNITQQSQQSIQLENLHVPYTIVFSPIDEALQAGN
ncbi:DUF3261 domain-containing protein [Acinetobacter sp. MD2(2019)]|uniref:DUF3261 domain-containing protein n=1 Tax=Acinetobacter sp. MD2(2019) TaxID=2605273 RepID=UPI002D1E959F|nr:DUF3261 domain-containing protein [Acinetobacter sp. MD2(2019)]MEB3753613.1 DUF3261 domain-containing protein [Acinetobacter sp. MD2(2019)]